MAPNATAPAEAKQAAPDATQDFDAQSKQLVDVVVQELEKRSTKLSADLVEKAVNHAREAVGQMQKEWSDDFAKRYPTFSLPGVNEGTKAKDKYNLVRAAMSLMPGGGGEKSAPLEWDAHRQMKALTSTSDTSAGLLIPAQMQDEIIMPLRDKSIAAQLGVRFVSAKGYIGIQKRRRVADLTASWVAEGGPVSGSDLKYTTMELRPRALRAKETVSNLLLEQSADLVNSEIMESARAQFSLAGDKAILIGSGQGNEPRGIANTNGILTSTLAGPTYDQLLDMVAAVRDAKALTGGQAAWAMSPQKFNAISKMRDGDNAGSPPVVNQPLERRMLASGPIDTLVGFPFQWTGQLPSSGLNAAIFGIFSNAFFLNFGTMRVRTGDVGNTDLDNDTTTIAIVMYADVGVDQPKAFCVASA